MIPRGGREHRLDDGGGRHGGWAEFGGRYRSSSAGAVCVGRGSLMGQSSATELDRLRHFTRNGWPLTSWLKARTADEMTTRTTNGSRPMVPRWISGEVHLRAKEALGRCSSTWAKVRIGASPYASASRLACCERACADANGGATGIRLRGRT